MRKIPLEDIEPMTAQVESVRRKIWQGLQSHMVGLTPSDIGFIPAPPGENKVLFTVASRKPITRSAALNIISAIGFATSPSLQADIAAIDDFNLTIGVRGSIEQLAAMDAQRFAETLGQMTAPTANEKRRRPGWGGLF